MVRLRCGARGCRIVLAEFDRPPAEWAGQVKIKTCPRHGGLRGSFFDAARRRYAKGLDPRPMLVLRFVAWRDLRPLFSEAVTRGRTVEDTVPPAR
jgi:hypothetical protein